MNGVSRETSRHTLTLDSSIYSINAVKKVAYRFADRASIIINPGQGTGLAIVFNFVGRYEKNDPEQVISDFCNELLDQDLREIINREAGPIRNLILAHAFSGTSLIRED